MRTIAYISLGFLVALNPPNLIASDPSANRRAIRFSTGITPDNSARPAASPTPTIKDSEKSVKKALNWLVSKQNPEGYWEGTQSKVAHTGLTVLCFLSYGVLPSDDTEWGRSLSKGLEWISKQSSENGDFRDGDKMYGQAIAVLTLAEAYILTKDKALATPLEPAVRFIEKAQNPKSGGWRHQPYPSLQHKGDLSITGWVIMALYSAKKAGIRVAPSCLEKAKSFVDSLSAGKEGGLYGYTSNFPTASMTSVGMFCRQVSEKISEDTQSESARHLATHLPSLDQKLRGSGKYHYWFYGTYALYTFGGKDWKSWHNRIVPILIDKQESDGSWAPEGPRARHEGRVVTTAWATLSLSVYYRCLPMLQTTSKKPKPRFNPTIIYSPIRPTGSASTSKVIQSHLPSATRHTGIRGGRP